ncbi:hypothetical protein [Allomuricauda sp. NBRC 101325]|uniref:hypothetical protein n=1 Tax=Allomuricauda sp. NBRC 101325 TaxID=1113758 RepID=UPI0024A4BF5A|nr:hypothetical protein [Muricauda sp. NBRC 101325]GLU43768.1 hypothetical protein Musp01_13920 [Muricauda sp. NBRC 101325]
MKNKIIILFAVACYTITFTQSAHAQSLGSKLGALIGKSNDLDPTELPDSYDFNWLFKTIVKDSKGNTTQMDFLFMDDDAKYYGLEMSNEQLKDQGKMFVVTDRGMKVSTMFMMKKAGMESQNMAQMVAIPDDVLDTEYSPEGGDYTFTELPPKVILNFNCKGVQMENDEYLMTLFYATDAPVSFFKVFGDDKKSIPKGFDPRWLDKMKDGLVMEMVCTNKKKDKFSFTMTAQSLDQKEFSIHPAEFQFMNGIMMGMGAKN